MDPEPRSTSTTLNKIHSEYLSTNGFVEEFLKHPSSKYFVNSNTYFRKSEKTMILNEIRINMY